ncbi:MAG: UbiA family prenyltransferase [bacterium]|nr:UbiA family prenyltransferase [bacterium]
MNRLTKLIEKIITGIEETPTGFLPWIVSFLCVIAARVLIESWINRFQNHSGLFIFYEFTHNLLFFSIAYLLFLILLKKTTGISFSRISNVLLWGYLIILTPPISDYIISGGKGFWSFYAFDGVFGLVKRFFTFFGDKPEIGITYGVRIEVAFAVILLFIYSFIKLNLKSASINLIKSAGIALAAYLIFFVLGAFPSYITIAIDGFAKGFLKVNSVDVAQMFLSPALIFSREIPDIVSSLNIKMSLIYSPVFSLIIILGLFVYYKEKFIAFLKNMRPPQVVYHFGLATVGVILGTIPGDFSQRDFWQYVNFFNIISFILLLEAVLLSWLASVVVNDLYDRKIDAKSNVSRPLIKNLFSENEYKILGIILFSFSLLFAAIVNFKIMLILAAYQAIAWIYSAWPFRLKRFAFISTLTSAIASILIVFSGYILSSPQQNIGGFSAGIIILLIFGFTFSLPIKDFKDIEGDRENNARTIPVVFGEYWGKIIVGSGIFVSFLLSVIVFNEPRLFRWAIIFGGLSFWLTVKMRIEGKINYQNIFWWIIGTVSIYGIILVKIIFLK